MKFFHFSPKMDLLKEESMSAEELVDHEAQLLLEAQES